MSSRDDDRARILARRARFVAAAVASLTACARDAEPQVCLSPPNSNEVVIEAPDAGPEENVEQPEDAGARAPDTGGSVELPPEAGPRICLSYIE
jgi:hypothetical protein